MLLSQNWIWSLVYVCVGVHVCVCAFHGQTHAHMHTHACVCICMTPPPGCVNECFVCASQSCSAILLSNTYASVFSPAARVAALRFGLSSGHRALHGHDRWSQ